MPLERPRQTSHGLIPEGAAVDRAGAACLAVVEDFEALGVTVDGEDLALVVVMRHHPQVVGAHVVAADGRGLRPLFQAVPLESTVQQLMGPYEFGFFLEACRLHGSSIQPYKPLPPEITGAVRAVSELLKRIASLIHAMEPEIDEQLRRRRMERQLRRLLNSNS